MIDFNDPKQMREYLSTHGWREYKPGRWLLIAVRQNGKPRLTDGQVVAIRKARSGGAMMADIARRYDVSVSLVSRICAGKRHVPKSLVVALALLLATVSAHAETRDAPLEPGSEFFSTSFAFYVRAPKPFAKSLDTTSTARVAIDLPAEFAGWRCYRTPESSTHALNFENVACWHGEFTTGISVSCHTDREWHDAKSFFLRAPGGVEVQISGVCMTTLETVRYDDGF